MPRCYSDPCWRSLAWYTQITNWFKHFMIFTLKHLWRGLFLNKVEGHQACIFIKKRLQQGYFLANIRKFIWRPIKKNISIERLHCWKVFCQNVFQIRSGLVDVLLMKRNYWWLAVWKIAQISQDWIKMLPKISSMWGDQILRKKRIKFLY